MSYELRARLGSHPHHFGAAFEVWLRGSSMNSGRDWARILTTLGRPSRYGFEVRAGWVVLLFRASSKL